jgi:hypothetical protein
MNKQPVIMVQIADREWTLEALHSACLMARHTSAQIALVKMIPVQHASWLGTEWGYMNFTSQEQADFADYQSTIEDYGVEFTPVTFQYVTLVEAIAQAAAYVDAKIIFVKIPESRMPLWTRLQRWMLNRKFTRQKCQWIQYPVYDPGASQVVIEAISEINALTAHQMH